MHLESLTTVIFDRLRECERRIRFTRSRAIRPHERLRRNSAARFGSCAVVVSHAAFRYPTSRTFAAWPDDWSFPRSSGGAPGVHPFAGLLPRRVDLHFCTSGPTCLFIAPPDPIGFRRVGPVRRSIVRVRVRVIGERAWDESMLASGCLPCAIRFAVCGAHACPMALAAIDPALGFASFRVVGTRTIASLRCASGGLEPA